MKSTDRLLLSVVAALAMTAGSAIAQQKGGGRGVYEAPDIVNLAAFEAVQQDLGVTGDAAQKLTQLRDDYRATVQKEYDAAGINPRDFPNRMTAEQRQKYFDVSQKMNDEFIPKTIQLLSTDQWTRLQQIRLQNRLGNQSPPAALLSRELSSELNLTKEQIETLNGLNRELLGKVFAPGNSGKGRDMESRRKTNEQYQAKAIDVLTAEQKETLNKLKGKEFDLSKLVPRGTR